MIATLTNDSTSTIVREENSNSSQEVADAIAEFERADAEWRRACRECIDMNEEYSRLIIDRVDVLIEEAWEDESVVFSTEWKKEVRFVANSLSPIGKYVFDDPFPPEYNTLKSLYVVWAECCQQLSRCLHLLTRQEECPRWPTRIRLCLADEELAAVNAHNIARRIYLNSLAA